MKRFTYFRFFFLLSAILLIGGNSAFSQTNYVLSGTPLFKVAGGSTLHDWEMVSESGVGQGIFVLENGQFKTVQSLTVSFQAETLKSGTRGLDSNAYKALKTDKYKEVRFVLKELTGQGSSMTAKGDLTIAGVTKLVSFPVKVSAVGNKLTFEGSLETRLTNFSITPPTALMGTVKTEDEIKLSFKSTFQPTL
ncbi:YceI family protein [Algoriphagus boritolerans]|uniref:YceI-like domain-containing protein n=2 Tax=Algoriphagus TaxID=246875 RepID=A0A1H5ZMK2_9BACT|nr:YceI family protein [Algoriphagus boritolerans]SEG37431.1 YceI-like domain-containing protein [Algoriphagus boritolerans DSM 17298 = JCM 18970]